MRRKIRNFLMALALLVSLSGMALAQVQVDYLKQCREEMDRRELWYDADGPFILVNETRHLVGVYDAITPIYHFSCRIDRDIEPNTVLTYADLEQAGVHLSWDAKCLIAGTVPESTPVLVYEEND